MEIHPVGVLRTCYPEKFGVPRQPLLVKEAWGEVVLEPAYAREEAVRGLEQFSHLWLVTLFHLVPVEHASLTARPPRLGGNERMGVFATRSPFRPNRIGLSVVELDKVVIDAQGVRLWVKGVDWVDGTPVLDIKPYIPYSDSIPAAHGGFADAAPLRHPVNWACAPPDDEVARSIIEDSISLSPQPAYQDDEARDYAAAMAGYEVRWRGGKGENTVFSCLPVNVAKS